MQRVNGLLIAGAVALAAASPAAAQKPATLVDVPMRFFGARPAVEVMVNGKGPFLFLIDTGAGGRARADLLLVRRLKLPRVGSVTNDDLSGRTQSVPEVRIDTLAIGKLRFRNVTANTRDYNTSGRQPRMDGILAFNLFSPYLLTLDYPNRRVRVARGALPAPDGKNVLAFESPDGTPLVRAAFGALAVEADVDSGDSGGISLPASLVSRLTPLSPPQIVGRGRSANSEFEVKGTRLRETFRIGGHAFPEPAITYTEVFPNVNLGSELLRRFSLTFDQKNRRLRLIRDEKGQ